MGVSVDEAYIDATGCGAPAEVAALIRSRVLERTVGPGIYITRRVTGCQHKRRAFKMRWMMWRAIPARPILLAASQDANSRN